mmetsp:Transcript_7492/g.17834  ORF Transcript_7492/g.17834 Transcript_7492/m.17834 type:complete len:377 (-) Transcript_7492:86-1216(-)
MAFRSHLMQQFAAAARQQSRPPLALAPLYGDGGSTASSQRRRETTASPSPPRRGPSTATAIPPPPTAAAAACHVGLSPRYTVQVSPRHSPAGNSTSSRSSEKQGALGITRSLSSLTATSLAAAAEEGEATATNNNNGESMPAPPSTPELQQSFQNLLKTRRTVSNLVQHPESSAHLNAAISRAVQCAVEAPNHKRTEPYTFTRLIAPSAATEALADVCYHVSVRRMREKQKGSEKTLLAEAERKRDRWRNIPAFLVAAVGGMPDQVPSDSHASHQKERSEYMYAELPFVPPQTELQLENYAATCAATQNVLLSLHAEELGSKWATGPVIRTKAFRDVVQLRNDELVVGLIMLGVPKRVPRSPKRRRKLMGDVLKDL